MSKDLIGYFSCDPETGAPVWDEGCICGDNIFSLEGTGTVGRPIMFADAPVAAQPNIKQRTLDDVMAGIPARDAEIEALRKEIEALQSQHATTLANIEAFVACDASAISYLSLGEYRTALLKMLREGANP
ncbi:hypothetical protein [Alcaligenes faecalis]|uniref:hypothetical protein n=1 Tax=Alcaligenes faecalis TaxID=511 RepID=UPI00208E6431|nr:hypothetical protein [Alcaligenes faecalis]USP49330.1 hypothetical protein J5J84_07550 [Alcaligenes faecalis]